MTPKHTTRIDYRASRGYIVNRAKLRRLWASRHTATAKTHRRNLISMYVLRLRHYADVARWRKETAAYKRALRKMRSAYGADAWNIRAMSHCVCVVGIPGIVRQCWAYTPFEVIHVLLPASELPTRSNIILHAIAQQFGDRMPAPRLPIAYPTREDFGL